MPATKDEKVIKARLQRTLYTAGVKLLKESHLIRLKEFDSSLLNQFEEEFSREGLDILLVGGRNRTRAENCVDWVKANLTRKREISYVELRGERYIAWHPPGCMIPPEGEGDGLAFYATNHVHALLRAIQHAVNDKSPD